MEDDKTLNELVVHYHTVLSYLLELIEEDRIFFTNMQDQRKLIKLTAEAMTAIKIYTNNKPVIH